jgi:predicted metal-dependent peptidase
MDRFATAAAQSKIDWKSALRKFVEQAAKADYSWSHPSRRYASMGLYLPGLHSESCPGIAIGVDTSGSMDDIALAKAKAEVIAVMDEVQPDFVEIMYADARVARVDRFERGEEIVFQPAGGGGTDFRPVFEHVDGMEEKPACIIYITDLYGSFPEGSDIPTLWVTDTDQSAPFGDTLKIE